MSTAGAVLAGGLSRRMGRAKALIAVGGRAMADRALDALRAADVAPLVVVGGGHDTLSAPSITDDFPGEGPVGGVITALRHAQRLGSLDRPIDRVVIVSCDLPLLSDAVVRALLAAQAGDAVAVAQTSQRREPLCAVWPVTALGLIEQRFAAGERAMHRVLADLQVTPVVVDDRTMLNVNTADDLEVAVGSSLVPIEEITVAELQALGADICLVDVREDDEWADAHVAHAVHVPLGTVPERLDAFTGSPTYVLCKVGGRSMRACEFAAERGHHVVNVAGGMSAWLAAGFETA